MPRVYQMSWDGKRARWTKMHRGQRFTIACSKLGVPPTKEESYQAANAWWQARRAGIHDIPKPQRPRYPFEDVAAAALGDPEAFASPERFLERYFDFLVREAGRQSTWLGNKMKACVDKARRDQFDLPEVNALARQIGLLEPLAPLDRHCAAIVRRVLERHILDNEPFPEMVSQHLSPDRLQMIEEGARTVRGESAAPPDRTVQHQSQEWLLTLAARVGAGNLAADRYESLRFCIRHFLEFLGNGADIALIDSARLQGFHTHLMTLVAARQRDSKAGLSRAYAREIFSVTKNFLRWLWERNLIELPRNIGNKTLGFGSVTKKIETWTVQEVCDVIAAATGKMKLALLLMANCGMTQKDVSDLRDTEVDWEQGRIIRKRSKTGDQKITPEVDYLLWPLTFRHLKKYRSGGQRVLVTKSGKPYWRCEMIAGKTKRTDGIAGNFARLRSRLGFKKSLKLLRKTSASLLETHSDHRHLATLFLGHAPQGMKDKHYAAPPQRLLDEAVAWLVEQYGFGAVAEPPS